MKWNILFKTTFLTLKNPQQELWQTYTYNRTADYYYRYSSETGNLPPFVDTGTVTGLLQPPELQNWTVGYSNIVEQDLFLTGENLTLSANNIHINCNRLFINGKEYDPNNIFNNSIKTTRRI